MCQRVMIALALACKPALLIADEPTTGLDVTTQAAILELIDELARGARMATILITHDLALARAYAERIVVMHAGHVVEDGADGRAVRVAAPSLHRQTHRVDPATGRHARRSLADPRRRARSARQPSPVSLSFALRSGHRRMRRAAAAAADGAPGHTVGLPSAAVMTMPSRAPRDFRTARRSTARAGPAEAGR